VNKGTDRLCRAGLAEDETCIHLTDSLELVSGVGSPCLTWDVCHPYSQWGWVGTDRM